MQRSRFLLMMAAFGLAAGVLPAADEKKDTTASVIVIEKGGGFAPADAPSGHYRFTVARDGGWELRHGKDKVKKGKLGADDLKGWIKDIEDGGFKKLKSNPALGAADEQYMEITVRPKAGDKAE